MSPWGAPRGPEYAVTVRDSTGESSVSFGDKFSACVGARLDIRDWYAARWKHDRSSEGNRRYGLAKRAARDVLEPELTERTRLRHAVGMLNSYAARLRRAYAAMLGVPLSDVPRLSVEAEQKRPRGRKRREKR